MRRLLTILRLRCPCCMKGRAFRTLWRMHDQCPECNVSFEREPGFFYGAMYFSYGIGLVLATPLCIFLFLKGVSEPFIFLAAIGLLAIVSTMVFRYSRVAWMHFDQRFDPR